MQPILIDQAPYTYKQAYSPFALTDLLIDNADRKQQSFLHFWQLEHTMILGMKDTRVEDLPAGVAHLMQADYPPVVRNSGGLGVIADSGILNISLVLPNPDKKWTTDQAYEQMLALTRKALPELAIEAYEVSDSYCPGKYDFSVNGQKIAGTAQRRIKDGVAVMMYLSVNGDQIQRGKVVREFYRQSLPTTFGTNGYPPVRSESMTTVAACLDQNITVEEMKQRFLDALEITDAPLDSQKWIKNEDLSAIYIEKLNRMIQRNQVIKELIDDDTL